MSQQFDPYHEWLGIPASEQPPNHYRLLGVPAFEESPTVIQNAADRQMAHLRTFQMGKHSAESQKLLNEVAATRLCLLNPDRKAAYDIHLRARAPVGPSVCRPGVPHSSPPPPPPPPIAKKDNSILGEYELLDQLGSGGTGPVYKARHRTMGRIVAVKILSPEATSTPELIARFRRKVKILAQLNHPNLVTAYDAGERDGQHYLIMEYFDSRDLAAVLKQHGPLSVRHVISYVGWAAAGLGHAHAQAIYHRNVKPSNLLVDKQGMIKVIGLGLARVDFDVLTSAASMNAEITAPRRALGTFDYMAPEQAVDARQVDHRADIYALGCTMCELLTGHPPYPGKSQMHKVLAHRSQPIPSLRSLRGDVPMALDALFQSMLAKRREDRPPSMDEVIRKLQAI